MASTARQCYYLSQTLSIELSAATTDRNSEHQRCEDSIARVCQQVKRRRAWAPVCSKGAREYCGSQVCWQVPVKVERLVPTQVQRRTCGVGGPGGPVHDGSGAGSKDYHVAVKY